MTSDLTALPATALLDGYAAKSFSPSEVMQAIAARLERLDPQLNAFCYLDLEAASAAAAASSERWAKGAPQGRLDGVPITIKDVLTSKGWPTLRGSKTVDPNQPWNEDAPAVARLRDQGAIFFGKTTTPEHGWKGVTDSPLTGITRNPWNRAMTPGGSSGGASAAAAACLGPLHFGTDGGGSIRIPAGFTGIVGHKPSFGRVPAFPSSPFGTVSHIGPMARTVADAALMLTTIAEPDARDPHSLPYQPMDYRAELGGDLSGLRVAFSPTLGGHRVDPEIAALVAAAAAEFSALGATVEEAEPDLPDCLPIFTVLWYAGAAFTLSSMDDGQKALLDPGLRRIAEDGSKIGLFDYLTANRAREAITRTLGLFHRRYDLLLTPTLPIPAFEAGKETPSEGGGWVDWTPFSYPFNLTQQPAASVPCGLTSAGLPAGLQIVGRRYDDRLVLKAADAFERARGGFAMPDLG
ncbi:MAG: amidase [Rhodospirillales bacterium]